LRHSWLIEAFAAHCGIGGFSRRHQRLRRTWPRWMRPTAALETQRNCKHSYRFLESVFYIFAGDGCDPRRLERTCARGPRLVPRLARAKRRVMHTAACVCIRPHVCGAGAIYPDPQSRRRRRPHGYASYTRRGLVRAASVETPKRGLTHTARAARGGVWRAARGLRGKAGVGCGVCVGVGRWGEGLHLHRAASASSASSYA
jgi:hypothetical protein